MDQILKTLSQDKEAVVIALDAKDTAAESMLRLHTTPPSMLHLGQAMLGGLLMQALPDRVEDERLGLQWSVEGPFGNLAVDCITRHSVRGTIGIPQAQVMSLREPLGNGLLQVRRWRTKKQGEIATGIVQASGNVITDLLFYLEQSEQKLCAMNVFVDLEYLEADLPENSFRVRRALGYLVHVLPAQNPQDTDRRLWAWHQHLESLRGISQWELAASSPTMDMLRFLTGEKHPTLTHQNPVVFECSCNESRAERALALSESGASAESPSTGLLVTCEFCGQRYTFPPANGGSKL
jgi:redox-regulated HSP33 family molecular chaperone